MGKNDLHLVLIEGERRNSLLHAIFLKTAKKITEMEMEMEILK